MHIIRFTTITTLITLAVSCASTKVELENSKFRTRIADSGLKHFEISLGNPRARPQNAQNPENRQGRPRERRVDPRKVKKLLTAYAKAHIEINNYCRKGFWFIDMNAYSPAMTMRGECNDAASEADREKFPDTIQEW